MLCFLSCFLHISEKRKRTSSHTCKSEAQVRLFSLSSDKYHTLLLTSICSTFVLDSKWVWPEAGAGTSVEPDSCSESGHVEEAFPEDDTGLWPSCSSISFFFEALVLMDLCVFFQTIVNLAEQAGREGVITQAYREYMQELNMSDASCVRFSFPDFYGSLMGSRYCEYDFHTETKGMK